VAQAAAVAESAPVARAGEHGAAAAADGLHGTAQAAEGTAMAEGAHESAAHISWLGEFGLMAFSVLIGAIGILVAYRFYVQRPQIAEYLAARWKTPHRVLTNKYYVDELYGATVVQGTMASANSLWAFDRNVVDGAVNGSGWFTILASWVSHLIDKYIVDGMVNLVGSIFHEASFVFRRLQTGLIQNYALLMLVGVFAFVSVYLLIR
jgi:NADH-quinone oxidoreductase subunit L